MQPSMPLANFLNIFSLTLIDSPMIFFLFFSYT